MKKLLYSIIFIGSISFAQVGIGTTTPDPSSQLDITSTDRGFLMPRVALTSTNDTATITGAEATGLLVYNTATANDVSPGFYYWNGTMWASLGNAVNPNTNNSWEINGNNNTNPNNNFVGTTNANDLVFRTNNTERFRIDNGDQVYASATGGTEARPFYSFVNDTNTGIWTDGADEFSLGAGGQEFLTIDEGPDVLVVNEDGDDINFRIETDDDPDFLFVDGNFNTMYVESPTPFPAFDVFATNTVRAGLFAINGYADVQGGVGIYGRNLINASAGNTSTAVAGDARGTGFLVFGGENIGGSFTGGESGIVAHSVDTNGVRHAGRFIGNDAAGNNGPEARIAGFESIARPNGAGGPANSNEFYGGYFSGGTTAGDFSYVGLNYRGTDYKIVGGGTVSTLIQDQDNNNRVMFAPEAPEVLFQDYGDGTLVNGEAYIEIDPVLAKNITVSKKHPLRVIIQLEGDCNGVYVTEKSARGFRVKELKGGQSNVSFTWHLAANRADKKGESGIIESKYEDLRLPLGPSKLTPFKKNYSKTTKR